MARKLGRWLVAVGVLAMSAPGVAWAAEKAGKALAACCGLPCCG